MNHEDKQAQRAAYHKQQKKLRTREERKLLEEHAKRRKGGARRRRGRREVDPEDGVDDFEPMRAAPQLDLRRALPASGGAAAPHGAGLAGLRAGLVVAVHRARARVRDGERELELALVPGGPRPAVGDTARYAPGAEPRLVALDERRSVISRPDPGRATRELVLAANVDLAVIVASVRRPELRPGLVDRFLVAIARGGATPLLVANKVDLLEDDAARAAVAAQLAPFEELGLEVLPVSAASGEGLDALAARLAGRTCVFVGHSGVGKSSLLNALHPDWCAAPSEGLDTGTGRAFDGKGRHTTTSAQLVELDGGTRLIDTPGIRSLGLWQVQRSELSGYFPEFAGSAGLCRFRDCLHTVEPDCGVREAVADGDVAAARYEAYRRILETLEE